MEYREKFIEAYTKYIYNKYFVSRLFEEKYINEFADFEIQRMQNIYDYLIIDSKIANKFMLPRGDYVDDANLLNFESYSEFQDLYNRIENLKSRKKINKKNLLKTEKYIGVDTFNKIKYIIEKSNPNINSSKIANKLWTDFISNLNIGNIDIIDLKYEEAKKLRIIEVKISEEFYKKLYETTKLDIISLYEYYPNNLESVFNSKSSVEEKYREMQSDLKKSSEALDAIQTMYLQLYEGNGLES